MLLSVAKKNGWLSFEEKQLGKVDATSSATIMSASRNDFVVPFHHFRIILNVVGWLVGPTGIYYLDWIQSESIKSITPTDNLSLSALSVHRRDRGETPVIEGEIGTALSHQVKLAQFGRSTNRLSL